MKFKIVYKNIYALNPFFSISQCIGVSNVFAFFIPKFSQENKSKKIQEMTDLCFSEARFKNTFTSS